MVSSFMSNYSGAIKLSFQSQLREWENGPMSYISYQHTNRKIIDSSIQSYATWASEHVEDGWDPYLVTFMFNHVPGSRAGVLRQMQRELERVYAISLTRVIRKPWCEAEQNRLPILIACPDFPVPKRGKQCLHDVTVND